jgi:hypothetical protein
LERSSKYHVIYIAKKTLSMQYIGSKLSNKTLFVYTLSNSNFCDPILWRKNGEMTTPISQNQHQWCHLMNFELTRRRGVFLMAVLTLAIMRFIIGVWGSKVRYIALPGWGG